MNLSFAVAPQQLNSKNVMNMHVDIARLVALTLNRCIFNGL